MEGGERMKAYKWLKQHKWVKKAYLVYSPDTVGGLPIGACLTGAIEFCYPQAQEAAIAINRLKDLLRKTYGHELSVENFNDTRLNTKAEAVALLKEVDV